MKKPIYLSKTQQKTVLAFITGLGVTKKGRSLKPDVVTQLAPTQLLSTEIMEVETVDNPSTETPERLVGLAEVGVQVGKKCPSWYVVVQLVVPGLEGQFCTMYSDYEAAQSAFRRCVYGPPPPPRLKPVNGQAAPPPATEAAAIKQQMERLVKGFGGGGTSSFLPNNIADILKLTEFN